MITSRKELKDYCKRALGAPVIEINCDDSQLEDRIDDAIDYWRQYHPDGIEKVFLKYLITYSELTVTDTTNFIDNESIIGDSTGATAVIVSKKSNTILYIKNITGVFNNTEIIISSISNITTNIVALTLGALDNKFISVGDLVHGINKVYPIAYNASNSMFDTEYQLRLTDLHDITSSSLIYYTTAMQYLDLIDYLTSKDIVFRFNKLQNKLFLDTNWVNFKVGQILVIECYRVLDPEEYKRMYDDHWLRKYTTALFKKQWGINIKKFQGVLLPGGVSLDGQGLYDEAMNEIADLESDLVMNGDLLDWFIG